ncbi:MAG: nitroreductase family protein [Sedimentisphaerales bacterium]|nr:nitroreductase family protein [Sedimentisphaerales bacterium]
MEVIEAIKNRYSCRDYKDIPVEKEKLEQIMEAARLAPSARNKQSWRFVVVTKKAVKEKIVEAANNQNFLGKAAAIIAGCSISKDSMRCGQRVAPIDLAIAMDHISLRATELGLATCWIGSFYPDKVRPILSIPDDIEIVELMAIGYPADKPRQTERLDMDEIVSYEKWRF